MSFSTLPPRVYPISPQTHAQQCHCHCPLWPPREIRVPEMNSCIRRSRVPKQGGNRYMFKIDSDFVWRMLWCAAYILCQEWKTHSLSCWECHWQIACSHQPSWESASAAVFKITFLCHSNVSNGQLTLGCRSKALSLQLKATLREHPQFSRSVVSDSATPWIAACRASLSITNSQSSLKLTSIESVMPSSNLILCRPLLLLTPIPPSIRVFSNESTLHLR